MRMRGDGDLMPGLCTGFCACSWIHLVPVFPAPVLDRLVGAPTYTSVVSRQ